MTEKEKCAAGLLYAPEEPELTAERLRAKDLCWRANQLLPSARDERAALLRGLLHADGVFTIEPDFWCDYGYNIHLGRNFYANHGLVILDAAPVEIGDDVMIAPQCGLYTAGHPLDAETRIRGLEYAYPIRIGDGVWLGGGVKVMPGVTIGAGSVIAGGSVVTRDIPAGVLAGGVPCRVLREITPADREKYRR